MLAARGVSLGLGKIHLSEINNLKADRATIGRLVKPQKKKVDTQPKLIVKKHVDSKTLWTACRAIIIGIVLIIIGMAMTIIGYFDMELSKTVIKNEASQENITVIDDTIRISVKSMQYMGPVSMGFGTFMLIIACVITLESRDKHAQIIQEESNEFRRSKRERINNSNENSIMYNSLPNGHAQKNNHLCDPKNVDFSKSPFDSNLANHTISLSNNKNSTYQNTDQDVRSNEASSEFLNINRSKPRGPAPMANFELLSLLSSSENSPNVNKKFDGAHKSEF